MSLIQRFLDKLRRKPPVIPTPHGPVTEKARAQAAVNLRLDPAKRLAVMAIIAKEINALDYLKDARQQTKVKDEARRRYPEVDWP